MKTCAEAGSVLVVNDYWRVAIDEGAPWVHLGQGDLDGADISAIRKAGLRLGVSTHDDAELERALSARSRLCRARPDLSDVPQGDGLRAAGPRAHRRVEAPRSARSPWSRSAGSMSSGRNSASPRAPTSSPSSPTSRSTPTRRRARENGSRRRGRRDHGSPIALTIAGSDRAAAPAIQADLKTFAALGVYGASAVTALTAQNTKGRSGDPSRAAARSSPRRSRRCSTDFDVAAIKIGMLGSAEIVGVAAEALVLLSPLKGRGRGEGRRIGRFSVWSFIRPFGTLLPGEWGEGAGAFIVYDPVMVASSGEALSGAGFVEASARSCCRSLTA